MLLLILVGVAGQSELTEHVQIVGPKAQCLMNVYYDISIKWD